MKLRSEPVLLSSGRESNFFTKKTKRHLHNQEKNELLADEINPQRFQYLGETLRHDYDSENIERKVGTSGTLFVLFNLHLWGASPLILPVKAL